MLASFLKRDLRNLIQRDASPNFQAQNGLLSLRSWWRSVRSLVFRLGDLLRAERKRARLTQAELAKQAGLSERTVWLLEQSGGNIPSRHAALCALGVELTARHFASSAGRDSQTLGRE